MNRARVVKLIGELLGELGIPDPEGQLSLTPAGAASALEFLTAGYRGKVARSVGERPLFRPTSEMVVARGLEFFSLCEHHLLPFYGRCHIATLGARHHYGLEELAEILETHTRRLQLQERLTEEIAHEVSDRFAPQGVAVALEARHLCLMMRGVGKQASSVSTSSVLGALRESAANRAEFFALVGKGDS
jgi:GTP cyclohydrolase I